MKKTATPDEFKRAMRRFAAGVTLVTTAGRGGRAGLTATAMCSLSADPPRLLVCVNRTTSLHALLVPTAPLSINLLGRDQKMISAAFGGGAPREERFRIGEWVDGGNGLPSLAGAQANMECVIDAMLAYGTHSIVIARVLRARVSDGVAPLIYQDGGYL